MNQYKLIKKLGEGTFSEVFKAQRLLTGEYVAMKCMKSCYKSKEEVEESSEVKELIRFSSHENVIKLIEVLLYYTSIDIVNSDEKTGHAALVFELMELNLYEAIKGKKTLLPEKKVRLWMFQILKALDCIHRKGLFHRDIKPENILLKKDVVKLADFGSCKGIYTKQPFTEYISTRWYRSPECLLTDGYYNFKMDIWGLGCVYFEILTLFPLFPGDDELDQISKINDVLGSPPKSLTNQFKKHSTNEAIDDILFKKGYGIKQFLPDISDGCIDLITNMLKYNPEERYSASQALRHPYFRDLFEQDCRLSLDNNNQLKIISNSNESAFVNKIEESVAYPLSNRKASKPKDKKQMTVFPLIQKKMASNELKVKLKEDNKQILLATFGYQLPLINKNTQLQYSIKKAGRNNVFGLNDHQNSLKQNISNNSFELNAKIISTQYSKKNGNSNQISNNLFIAKKTKYPSIIPNKLKYISPYSQKIISNNLLI